MPLSFADPLPPAPFVNVALVGPPKTGKTAGAASAPGPVAYCNFDLPNATRFAREKYGDEHVREVEFPKPTEEQKSPVLDTMHDLAVAAWAGEFKTVVLDPVGDLYRRLLEEKTSMKLRFGIEHRGDVSTMMARMFHSLCEAPCNFVAVAHEMPVQDEGSGETRVFPFTGTQKTTLGAKLLGMVDVIAYTGISYNDEGAPTFWGQLVAQNGRPGGDRFNCLADPKTGSRVLDLSEWIEAIRTAENTKTKTKETKTL